jgi:hypothetical protein
LVEGDRVHQVEKDLLENFEKGLAPHLHWLRLQQSESVLTLLCAGKPHDPFVRFVRMTRFDEWNCVLAELANGVVPKKLEIRIRGQALSFREWLKFKICGLKIPDEGILDIEEFIVQESGLLKNRHIVNAIKHGGRICQSGLALHIGRDGVMQEIISYEEGIRWVGWDIRSNVESLLIGFQEINSEVDLARISFGALLAKAIVDVRRGFMDPEKQAEFFLPSKLRAEKLRSACVVRVDYE